MATVILVDWDKSTISQKSRRYAETCIQRWAERQGGAAFVSVESNFIITDYRYDHKEVELLRHILNCNSLSYRAVANIDLVKMGEEVFACALINKHNKS